MNLASLPQLQIAPAPANPITADLEGKLQLSDNENTTPFETILGQTSKPSTAKTEVQSKQSKTGTPASPTPPREIENTTTQASSAETPEPVDSPDTAEDVKETEPQEKHTGKTKRSQTAGDKKDSQNTDASLNQPMPSLWLVSQQIITPEPVAEPSITETEDGASNLENPDSKPDTLKTATSAFFPRIAANCQLQLDQKSTADTQPAANLISQATATSFAALTTQNTTSQNIDGSQTTVGASSSSNSQSPTQAMPLPDFMKPLSTPQEAPADWAKWFTPATTATTTDTQNSTPAIGSSDLQVQPEMTGQTDNPIIMPATPDDAARPDIQVLQTTQIATEEQPPVDIPVSTTDTNFENGFITKDQSTVLPQEPIKNNPESEFQSLSGNQPSVARSNPSNDSIFTVAQAQSPLAETSTNSASATSSQEITQQTASIAREPIVNNSTLQKGQLSSDDSATVFSQAPTEEQLLGNSRTLSQNRNPASATVAESSQITVSEQKAVTNLSLITPATQSNNQPDDQDTNPDTTANTETDIPSDSKLKDNPADSTTTTKAHLQNNTLPEPEASSSRVIRHLEQSEPSLGTTSAKEGKNVSHDAKQNETAAPAEKKLPGATIELPVYHAVSAAHQVHSVETAEPMTDTMPNTQVTEKLVNSILHEVTVFRQIKPDKLNVVLRPDPHTQISLQLRINNGQVEGQARCERGDFNVLSAHWNELQRTFEQQGIRLYPLKDPSTSASFSGGSNNDFSRSRQEQKARQLEELVISDIAHFPSTVTSKSSAAVSAARSDRSMLQTWA